MVIPDRLHNASLRHSFLFSILFPQVGDGAVFILDINVIQLRAQINFYTVDIFLAQPGLLILFFRTQAFRLGFMVQFIDSLYFSSIVIGSAMAIHSRRFIPASNEPKPSSLGLGDCREGQIPRCSAALQV